VYEAQWRSNKQRDKNSGLFEVGSFKSAGRANCFESRPPPEPKVFKQNGQNVISNRRVVITNDEKEGAAQVPG